MRRLSAAPLIIAAAMFPPARVRAQTMQVVDDAKLPRFEAASLKRAGGADVLTGVRDEGTTFRAGNLSVPRLLIAA